MSTVPALGILLLFASCGPRPNGGTAATSPAPVRAPAATLSAEEAGIFERVNRERTIRGLDALAWDARAAESAREHSREMAARWYFSHMGRDGRQVGERLRDQGVHWQLVGENIFQHSDDEDTAALSVSRWMISAGHRENILKRGYTHTGVGVAVASDGTVYCTQVFFRPGS